MSTSVAGPRGGRRIAWGGQSIGRSGILAALTLVGAPLAAYADDTPSGMVRYTHPVYHKGHLVLWHGTWRAGGAAKKGEAADSPVANGASVVAEAKPDVAKPDTAKPDAAKPDAAKPAEFSILVDADDPSASRLAAEFIAALQMSGAKGRVVSGHASPAALAKAVQTDDADLAIAPMDALIENDSATKGWRDRSPFIARLGAETIEVVAPREIADVRALAGRDVGFGASDSAGAATASTLFLRLGIAANPSFGALDAALAAMASGKLAAVVVVGGQASAALADFGRDGRFHLLAIPCTPSTQALYAPARLTAKERPNLIAADEKIDTLAAPRGLIALDAAPSTPRAEQFAGLTKAFFEGFDQLLAANNDVTWRDVNLAAGAPWPRLRAAQAWIDLNANAPDASLDAFRAVAKTATLSGSGPRAEDSDRLYESLMQWRSEAQ